MLDAEDQLESDYGYQQDSTTPRSEVQEGPGICPLGTEDIIARLIQATEVIARKPFYDYQRVFCWRIVKSVIETDGATITGLWARQCGKCLHKSTPVMLYNGRWKRAENVRVGDRLMGDDSTPRRVLSLARGRERMVRVVPLKPYHAPYVVNESHVLSVYRLHHVRTKSGGRRRVWRKEDVTAAELLKTGTKGVMGYKARVELPEQPLPLDPYFLGVWLGDGASNAPRICTPDPEIVAFLEEYAERLGMRLTVVPEREGNAATSYHLAEKIGAKRPDGVDGRGNRVMAALRALGIWGNKHIPQIYRLNSRENRLQLLAGLLDTDGHRFKDPHKASCCEVTFKHRRLAKGIRWLARSLGLRASTKPKVVNGTTYYRTHIFGDLSVIPMRIERKKFPKVTLRDMPEACPIRLERLPEDDYYGFEIDGNRRFLLGDFTVTHNTTAISHIAVGMAILLPALAKAFPRDKRFMSFKEGIKIGIYAPKMQQADISFGRMRDVVMHKDTEQMMQDPDLGVWMETNRGDKLAFSNGSVIISRTASEATHIEGETHHLVFLEESQKLSHEKVNKEIRPMLSSNFGTLVAIGTAGSDRGAFHNYIQQNIRDFDAGGERNHFQFDWIMVAEEKRRAYERDGDVTHLNYERAVLQDRDKYGGEHTPEFLMNYCCQWMEKRIIAIDLKLFRACALLDREADRFRPKVKVAGLDIGGTLDKTVLTIGEVDLENPVRNTFRLPGSDDDKQLFYPKTVVDWLMVDGAFEGVAGQYEALVAFLLNTGVQVLVIDATGKGDPVYQRLDAMLAGEIVVVPFVYSLASKSIMSKYFLQEFNAGRFKYVAGPETREREEYKFFCREMEQLDRIEKGGFVSIKAPPGEHDDFPNSGALMCLAEKMLEDVLMPELTVLDQSATPLFGGGYGGVVGGRGVSTLGGGRRRR